MLPEDSGAEGVGPDRREARSQSFHSSSSVCAVSLHKSIVKGQTDSSELVTIFQSQIMEITQLTENHLVQFRNFSLLRGLQHPLTSADNLRIRIRSGSLYRRRIRSRIRI